MAAISAVAGPVIG